MDDERIGIDYTGHPFFDVGLATITSFAGKTNPRELTANDLEAAAQFIEQNYTKAPLKKDLARMFTNNAWFHQASYDPDKSGLTSEKRTDNLAKRTMWGKRHLYQWQIRDNTSDDRCIFTDLSTARDVLADTLTVGRAASSQVPLLLGNSKINFFANGDPGIPISGQALLALQWLPMGCATDGKRFLAVHSGDAYLTFAFAAEFRGENFKAIALTQQSREAERPSLSRSSKTLLISTLLKVENERRLQQVDSVPASVTAYNFFNRGQEADLQIYHLPMEAMSFIRKAKANYEHTWLELASRSRTQSGTVRLYEDCFTLPDGASTFVRRYFLRSMRRFVADNTDDANTLERRAIEKLCLDLWSITAMFLKEVIRMRDEKIQAITEASDRLAQYISTQGAKRFFRAFSAERNYDNFRQRLIGELQRGIKEGTLLIGFNEYITLFQDDLDEPYANWRLIRDLMVIRILERLFSLHQADLVESADDSDDDDSSDN